MSEIETHKGKLVPMILDGWTPEERAESACKKFGFELGSCYESWLDCLKDEGYGKVYIRGSVTYEVQDEKLDPYGYAQATKNKDHTIDYCLSFHNGGAGFDEALDSAMDNVIKEEDADD